MVPLVSLVSALAWTSTLLRVPTAPCAHIRAAESGADQFSLASAMKRMQASYQEGYEQVTRKFSSSSEAQLSAPAPLRRIDRFASIGTAVVLVEIAIGAPTLLVSWLAGADPLLTSVVSPQVRLFNAVGGSLKFRSHTRMWRLLLELLGARVVASRLAYKPVDERLALCADRTKQAVAVLLTITLTIRACNRGWLAASMEPAGAVLLSRAAGVFARLISPFHGVLPDCQLCEVVAQVTRRAWTALAGVSASVRAWDSAARSLPPLVVLDRIAQLEVILQAPVQFIAAALKAAFDEVLIPGLRRLGWITMQTLG